MPKLREADDLKRLDGETEQFFGQLAVAVGNEAAVKEAVGFKDQEGRVVTTNSTEKVVTEHLKGLRELMARRLGKNPTVTEKVEALGVLKRWVEVMLERLNGLEGPDSCGIEQGTARVALEVVQERLTQKPETLLAMKEWKYQVGEVGAEVEQRVRQSEEAEQILEDLGELGQKVDGIKSGVDALAVPSDAPPSSEGDDDEEIPGLAALDRGE